MNVAKLSIKRPIFISSIVILMVVVGLVSLNRLGVDLFPPIDFPVVTVVTTYPGASPEEIEKLITKPLEEQVSTISGIKRLSSRNMEGVSAVIAEFTYETNVQYAEEKMREKVSLARNELPDDLLDEPVVRQFDFTDQPVQTLAVTADLPPTELYDLVKERIKPIIEQVDGVGEVRLSGGTRREIQIELDRNKLNAYEISAFAIANQLRNSGANVPIGKYDRGEKSVLYRTIGQYENIDQIKKTVVSFAGDVANSVTVEKLGTVRDGAEEMETMAMLYYPKREQSAGPGFFKRLFSGEKKKPVEREMKPCIILDVFKQSGANTVAVADGIASRLDRVNDVIKTSKGNPRLVFVYETAKHIRRNVDDVKETMIIGILLAVVVVYLFLGNIRSTIITGIAIPNSILGAFVLMYFMGFTINMMTLLALSLSVGLLVDDAIVVRENIFRKLASGMHPFEAAEAGTTEVMLAVIATTMTIIAVFLPIGFLSGIIGRFFKQFGLAVVFAMGVSLFDALTVAPLLSGYFAGSGEKSKNIVVRTFDRFQDWLEETYGKMISFSLNHPVIIILVTGIVFLSSLVAFGLLKKTFSPDPDEGEFLVNIEMPPGTSLEGTKDVAMRIFERMKKIPELNHLSIQVGNESGEYNKASLGVFMVPRSERKRDSNMLKLEIRNLLKEFSFARASVDNFTRISGGGSNKPFMLALKGNDLDVLNAYAEKTAKMLERIPDLIEVSYDYQIGKPELQVRLKEQQMQMLGVTNKMAGMELRYHIEGGVVGKFHESGLEYDVRMRLKPEQRDLRRSYRETRVPNIQYKTIPLTAVADVVEDTGPSKITRQDRSRAIIISANLSPGGAVGTAMDKTIKFLTKDNPMPPGVSYAFIGQADAFKDTVTNIVTAFVLSLIFIYLVLASLYDSFITPITILLALPPALSGGFLALFITGKLMDMFSMIGTIMLMGLVTKNSILLVDFALEGVRSGLSRKEAITRAGMIRLRPILMTTFAMLAGTAPVALGVGEAAKYRTGMGVVIMGGLIVSTLITLIVVPAVFEYIDLLRERIEGAFRPKPLIYPHGKTEVPEVQLNDAACIELPVRPMKGKKKSLPRGMREI